MTVPDFQSLMLPVLECAAEGEMTVGKCIETIAGPLGLSEDDLAEVLSSGRQTVISNRVHWAKSYMEKAGLVERVRHGVFTASAQGKALLATKPARIDKELLAQYPAFLTWLDKRNDKKADLKTTEQPMATVPTEQTPEEVIEAQFNSLATSLREEVLDRLLAGSAFFFEQVIIDLLLAMGYGGGRAEMGKAFQKSGDGGVDGIVKGDPLGLDVVYVQAKRYQVETSIGSPDVQKFFGSLEGFGANKGVFVTTSSYSAPAKAYVEKVSKRIILIDGQELARLMVKYGVGVRTRATYEIKGIDEDYFGEGGT